MSFDLKTTVQPDAELSPQQKKLNRLIEKIEQQKIDLVAWEKAQADIQQHARKTLVPAYNELHTVLFQQLEQLWKHLHGVEFSKAEVVQLDEKIQNLAAYLKDSKALSAQQANTVEEIDTFYQQHTEHTNAKKTKKKLSVATDFVSESSESDESETAFDRLDDWDHTKHEQQREQAKLKKLQEKREQAQKMAEQSLKTVYLKITAVIHPDREQDESKKLEKTEMLQHANAAYEKQDLFYLLKLQIQIEQNRGISQKGLSAEQVKFYKLALDAQSQKLDDQINDIIDSLVWSENTKIAVQKSKGKVQISDLYKQIDADTSALKQQVKWEKERLKYMSRVKGLEMLLENGAL
ncbi:molecular chaperone DnaJ [Acinetobacter sp. ANC 5378]|uniref:molecular chaperone DnaJ n=1 Tax=Acinetobacter sp. ANC 5378 TaxID=2731249 RepID=UPI0014901305|nr:molecular chaperone DnaJ [Acinetobacter sp. ANC 5378]NNG80447.1 molecular chaperone DnaJ [Acinetobacter sp. ANC 5378]